MERTRNEGWDKKTARSSECDCNTINFNPIRNKNIADHGANWPRIFSGLQKGKMKGINGDE